MARRFVQFNHKEANFRLSVPADSGMIQTILRDRAALDRYIRYRPLFKTSLVPLPDTPGPEEPLTPPAVAPPETARRMMEAARLTGLGPMAAVAGGFAQRAVEAALAAGEIEAIAENGGDVVLRLSSEMILGIHPGEGPLKDKLAFRILPEEAPLSLCSSSGRMGHSLSLGRADLVTVCGEDGFIADAAATLGGNLVKVPADMPVAVDRLLAIPGVRGVLLICEGKIALGGRLPEIIRNGGPGMEGKITRDQRSGPLN
jgi:hypothetical protein